MCLASLRLAEVLAEEDHPVKALRQELRLHRLVEEIALDPFSEVDVADYLKTRSPEQAASESLVRTLHARTDGLPLFLVNVVDEWLALGPAGAGADTMASSDRPVPESLAGVIERQIGRLEPESRTLLRRGRGMRRGVLRQHPGRCVRGRRRMRSRNAATIWRDATRGWVR